MRYIRIGTINTQHKSSRSSVRYRPKEQIYSCIWDFHKYDVDCFPSVLHGHFDNRYKLDALDGCVYHDKKCVGHASKKEMKRLYSDKAFQRFALERIEWYREQYPQINIEIPDWLDVNECKKNVSYRDDCSEISFTIEVMLDIKR